MFEILILNLNNEKIQRNKKIKVCIYLMCIGNAGYEGSGDETRNEITQ